MVRNGLCSLTRDADANDAELTPGHMTVLTYQSASYLTNAKLKRIRLAKCNTLKETDHRRESKLLRTSFAQSRYRICSISLYYLTFATDRFSKILQCNGPCEAFISLLLDSMAPLRYNHAAKQIISCMKMSAAKDRLFSSLTHQLVIY